MEIEQVKTYIEQNPNYKINEIQRLIKQGYDHTCRLVETLDPKQRGRSNEEQG